jgi:hypothetical protein
MIDLPHLAPDDLEIRCNVIYQAGHLTASTTGLGRRDCVSPFGSGITTVVSRNCQRSNKYSNACKYS